MPRLAVTGGIAEGKSTVLAYLDDCGYKVASSDDIAHEIFHGDEVQSGLRSLLGAEGSVSQDDLRATLWKDPLLRRGVNKLMHPLILRAIQGSPADAIEIPLLVETCLQGLFDRVWVVTCGAREQRRRLLERVGDESRVDAMIATQLPTEAKLPFADVVVRTNRAPEDVNRFVVAMARRSLS